MPPAGLVDALDGPESAHRCGLSRTGSELHPWPPANIVCEQRKSYQCQAFTMAHPTLVVPDRPELESSARLNTSLTSEWLKPLLEPRSIAIVGASERPGSFGRTTLAQTLTGGFNGQIYPVNPKQREILGLNSYPSPADLPDPADLVVLVVANAMLEEQLRLAATTGCRAATIFASAYLEGDKTPLLTERLRQIAREARMPLCGSNCMGFYHPARGVNAGWYEAGKLEPGPIGLISHSGSLFLSLAANAPRVPYSLFVSPGQELVVTAGDLR